MEPCAALVLAAGKSTRMKSATSKLLHEVAGVPIIRRVARTVARLGISRAVVVASHQKEAVMEAFHREVSAAVMVDQGEPMGTGHAVQCGMAVLKDFEGDVLILAGDVPLLGEQTLERFIALHHREEALLSLMTMEPANPVGYGRIIRDEPSGRVLRIIEQRDLPGHLLEVSECNGGIYLIRGPWLAERILTLTSDNSQGELYLTDLVEPVPADRAIAALKVPEEELLGVNTRAHLALAENIAQRRLREAHMAAGVTFITPETVTLHETVRLGADTVLFGGVSLRGDTTVGQRCVIDQGSVLTDVVLHDDVRIRPYSVLEKSEVLPKAEVGPFSHLRPATVVGPGAKVGNFVECKKTTLHEGVKANHLTYLGDAEVGAGSNIGAGTITCNYDGVHKFRTVIGEQVFIGSDSQLIAPVTIGNGAYVGTGTTVFDDVPPRALAVNPKKQRNDEHFVPPKERGK